MSLFQKDLTPKSESSSEEKLRSPKNTEAPVTPVKTSEESKKISPCVTLSRGKDNARREMKKKLEEGTLSQENRFRCPIQSPPLGHFSGKWRWYYNNNNMHTHIQWTYFKEC